MGVVCRVGESWDSESKVSSRVYFELRTTGWRRWSEGTTGTDTVPPPPTPRPLPHVRWEEEDPLIGQEGSTPTHIRNNGKTNTGLK